MKKIKHHISSLFTGLTILMAVIMSMHSSGEAADESSNKAQIISVSNPQSSYGIQIGDELIRKVVIKVPKSFELNTNDCPKKGRKIKVLS